MNLEQQIDDLIKNYKDCITLQKDSSSELLGNFLKSGLRKESLDANNGHNLTGRVNGETIVLCPTNHQNKSR